MDNSGVLVGISLMADMAHATVLLIGTAAGVATTATGGLIWFLAKKAMPK